MRTLSPLLLALVLFVASAGPVTVGAQAGPPNNSKIDPTLLSRMAANAAALQPIVLEMERASVPFSAPVNAQRAQQALSMISTYGQAVGALPIVDAAAGLVNAAGIQALSSLPGVAFVHEDARVGPRRSAGTGAGWPPGQLASAFTQEVKASLAWPLTKGAGVTVAVLDSGVAASADFGSRLLASVNFAGPMTMADMGGHGSHIAGIVASDGTVTQGQYIGIAPRANIVDVRVLGAQGQGRISSVLAGIGWAVERRQQYNIRVLNLSFGAPPPPTNAYRTDLLSAAVELAWKRGMTIVVAAGNTGPNSGTVQSPGIDPYVITVGATDDKGTLSLADDGLAWFSSWGTTVDGRPRPDVVAPGRKLVSERVPGSKLDQMMPDHVMTASNGATVFRLTGTSQSTAVVSGIAALMLARNPGWTPEQIKAGLIGTTQPYGPPGGPVLADPSAHGAGLVDAQAAVLSAVRASVNSGLRPAHATARVLYPALYGQPLTWRDPSYQSIAWNTLTWATLSWDNIAWDNIAWDNIAWDNIAWDNIAWDNIAWDNIAWDNIAWDNIAWDNIAWDNIAWD
jgi:subtilisin family serine protease